MAFPLILNWGASDPDLFHSHSHTYIVGMHYWPFRELKITSLPATFFSSCPYFPSRLLQAAFWITPLHDCARDRRLQTKPGSPCTLCMISMDIYLHEGMKFNLIPIIICTMIPCMPFLFSSSTYSLAFNWFILFAINYHVT